MTILKMIAIKFSGLIIFIFGCTVTILVYSHNGYIIRPLGQWFNSLSLAEFWHILLGLVGFIFIIIPVILIPLLIPLIGLIIFVARGNDGVYNYGDYG